MKITTTLLPLAFLLAISPQAGIAGMTELKADDRGTFHRQGRDRRVRHHGDGRYRRFGRRPFL